MCNSCMHHGYWLQTCSDGRGPQTPSPPLPPAHPVALEEYPTTSSVLPSVSGNSGHSHRSRYSQHWHRRGGSGQSGDTGNSGVSGISIDSTATINSVHSLRSLARHISSELYPQETLVSTLQTWLATVDPAAYKREQPWPTVVLAAYNEYKSRAIVHETTHQAFEAYLRQTRKYTTPEEHLERARLAVEWGQAALSVAEGRLSFIDTYRNAYSSTNSIKNHIKSGRDAITSGRNAVEEARRNYEALWTAYSRTADPQVFQ